MSYLILSRLYLILSYRVLSCLILPDLILSYPFNIILPYLSICFYLVLSHPIQSYRIVSYLLNPIDLIYHICNIYLICPIYLIFPI